MCEKEKNVLLTIIMLFVSSAYAENRQIVNKSQCIKNWNGMLKNYKYKVHLYRGAIKVLFSNRESFKSF